MTWFNAQVKEQIQLQRRNQDGSIETITISPGEELEVNPVMLNLFHEEGPDGAANTSMAVLRWWDGARSQYLVIDHRYLELKKEGESGL